MWNFLEWPNRWERRLDQETDQGEGLYAPLSFPDDDTKISLTFEISMSEFTKVYSSLVKGALLSYPDESEDVCWYFLRNFEFPIMTDCADTLDCIENDQPTREVIQDIFQRGTTPRGGFVMGGDDDLDRLFGFIRFLVDTMHDAIVDVFQITAEEGDLRKRARLLFEAIPGAELLPVDEGAEYADDLINDIGQEFDANYTTTPETGSRDRISCGLFCLARDNGNQLEWSQIRDWFWQEVSFESPGLNQFLDFANFLITGSWAGQDIVNISFANFAAAMDASGRYGELLFPTLGALSSLGRNNPDPDWAILCDECPPPIEECIDADQSYDFRVNDGGFVESVPGYGEWHAGTGWGVGSFGFTVTIQRENTNPIIKARFYTKENADGAVYLRQKYPLFAAYTGPTDSGTEGALFWYEWTLETPTVDGICFQINPSSSTNRIVRGCLWYEA